MRITLISLGSTGDVRPFILVGQELKKIGYGVTLAAFESFREKVADSGLEFAPVSGDVTAFMGSIMKPDSKGIAYLKNVKDSIASKAGKIMADLTEACKDADGICCNFFTSGFYSIAEYYKIPCVQINFFVVDPNANVPMSSVPGAHLGPVWCRGSYCVAYFGISTLEKSLVNSWRKEHGTRLPGHFSGPLYYRDGWKMPVINAVSPTLFPRPVQWPQEVKTVGFIQEHLTGNEEWKPPEELADFLAKPGPVVAAGFGSMVYENMEEVYRMIMEAASEEGVRLVLLTGWGIEEKGKLPEHVTAISYVPHNWLYKRVDAVIHHGGAGTTAAGLQNGKPSLIIPFGGDQEFWGECVYRQKAGPRPIPVKRLNKERFRKALHELIHDSSYRKNAELLAKKMRQEDGLTETVRIIDTEMKKWNGYRNWNE